MVARSNKGTFILAILLEALEHHLGDPFTRTRTRTAQPLPLCWSLCPKIGKVASTGDCSAYPTGTCIGGAIATVLGSIDQVTKDEDELSPLDEHALRSLSSE